MTARRSLVGALLLTVLLAVYLVAAAGRGLDLVRTGIPVAMGIGVAILVLPLLGVLLIAREWRLAVVVQKMSDELAAQDLLPVDDLPRSPGGRIDRAAADASFEAARLRVEQNPQDWAAWFALGFAYDAAGDRRRAREALRTAARLRSPRPTGAR